MPQAKNVMEGFEETDPIFVWVEKNWAEPCTDAMPAALHGLCMFAPALMVAMLLVTLVSVLVWCESRQKAKQPIDQKETKEPQKESKKSK